MKIENKNAFSLIPVDGAYINVLVNLVNACRAQDVKIDTVRFFQNGWHVTFVGHSGCDAICHDGSYGSPCYMGDMVDAHKNDWENNNGKWETMGFPWDNEDVSVHNAQELAFFIKCLDNNVAPWEADNEDC